MAANGEDDMVAEAIRLRAISILKEPLTVATARRLERLISAAVPLLQAESPGAEWLPNTKAAAEEEALFSWQDVDGPSGPAAPPYATSSPAENAGTRAIREFLAMIPSILAAQRPRVDPDATVRAIIAAEEAGLKDIAARLREELLEGAP